MRDQLPKLVEAKFKANKSCFFLAAGSGPAKEVFSKARWDCKELTCSPKYLEESMPQTNHSRFLSAENSCELR